MSQAIDQFADRWGCNLDMMAGRVDPALAYSISSSKDDGHVDTLKLTMHGRWGNYVFQLICLFHVAMTIGATRVVIFKTPQFDFESPMVIEGISIVSHDDHTASLGQTMSGVFFNEAPFGEIMHSLSPSRRKGIAEIFIRPLMRRVLDRMADIRDGALVINIRSGDIFEGDPASKGGTNYPQPPLSFYLSCLRRASNDTTDIVIITEGCLNPTVLSLTNHLGNSKGALQLRINQRLNDDLPIMINCKRMVFANGSFGIACALLSQSLQEGYFFRSNTTGTMVPITSYLPKQFAMNICHDIDHAYIGENDWRNRPEQIKQMIDFPDRQLQWLQSLPT